MTFREFCLRAIAYERTSLQSWYETRWLGLKIIEPHLKKNSKVTVFDILPLPGDPTQAELREQSKKQAKSQIDNFEKLKVKYMELGLISELPPKQEA